MLTAAVTFWLLSFLMIGIALACVLPWLFKSFRVITFKNKPFIVILVMLFVPTFCYVIYSSLGNVSHLNAYYSDLGLAKRAKQFEIRPLLAELGKDEVRLRLRLEESPDDIMAQCKLLDILAIRALQVGDKTLARGYWQEALHRLPKAGETEDMRLRINDLIQRLDLKSG